METTISSEIDLTADGKRSGYLRLPHSTHRSAYGWIPIPITVIRNGDGPTVLLLAGVHGDEYEGQIALTKLVSDLAPEQIRGRLVILPATNAPAVEAGTRTSPIDGGNLNREFPGAALGTPTQKIAHYIEEILLPSSDYLIDLHSGGTSLYYPPTLLRGKGHTPEEARKLRGLQSAFDLPFAWVFNSGGRPNSTARTAMGAANRKGVTPIMAELGGGGAVSKEILSQTERGLYRVLHHLGMLPGYEEDAPIGTRALHALGVIAARDPGLFEPFKEIGDEVSEEEVVGQVHSIVSTSRAPVSVISPYDGIVLCKRMMGQVICGDAVFQIARDADV